MATLAVRALILKRASAGELPFSGWHRLHVLAGSGASCACCQRAVTVRQKEYCVDMSGVHFKMHAACYRLWTAQRPPREGAGVRFAAQAGSGVAGRAEEAGVLLGFMHTAALLRSIAEDFDCAPLRYQLLSLAEMLENVRRRSRRPGAGSQETHT